MKRVLFWFLCSVLGASGVQAETVNRIVAVVNEDIITEADVLTHANALLAERGTALDETQAGDMQRAILQRLIEQRLLLQEAKRAGISVSADEVAKRFDEVQSRFPSAEEFESSLASSNLSRERLREQLRDQLLVDQLIDTKVRATIVVSPYEVAQELAAHPELAKTGDRVHASHILVRVDEERSEEQARARIEEAYRRLVAGESFATLAKSYSEDSHAQDGGMMDWVAQGELMPELDAVLFSLQSGEYSKPIQTRLGFHLLRLEERRTSSSLSMTEANQALFRKLYQQKFQQTFSRWLGDLKRRAYIDIITPTG